MNLRLWLLLSALATAAATYCISSAQADVPVKKQGSVISRAVEAFDRAGVAYAYIPLGGEKFLALATRLGYDEHCYYDIRGLKFGEIVGKPAMSDAQLIALATHIAAFPQLTLLEMRGNHFTAKGLASVPPLPALTHLRLSGPSVTDDIVNVLERFPALQELWLDQTSVTAVGFDALKKRFPYCKVVIH